MPLFPSSLFVVVPKALVCYAEAMPSPSQHLMFNHHQMCPDIIIIIIRQYSKLPWHFLFASGCKCSFFKVQSYDKLLLKVSWKFLAH